MKKNILLACIFTFFINATSLKCIAITTSHSAKEPRKAIIHPRPITRSLSSDQLRTESLAQEQVSTISRLKIASDSMADKIIALEAREKELTDQLKKATSSHEIQYDQDKGEIVVRTKNPNGSDDFLTLTVEHGDGEDRLEKSNARLKYFGLITIAGLILTAWNKRADFNMYQEGSLIGGVAILTIFIYQKLQANKSKLAKHITPKKLGVPIFNSISNFLPPSSDEDRNWTLFCKEQKTLNTRPFTPQAEVVAPVTPAPGLIPAPPGEHIERAPSDRVS